MFLFSNDLGVDLGTSNVLIYADGKGLVVREPSVVAMDKNTGKILQVGAAARNMLGRTPGNVVAMHPLKDGTVSDHEMTVRMLQEMFKTATKASFFTPKPRVVISVPSGVSEVEERSVINAAIEAGARRVFLIEEPLAAGLGAGLDIRGPSGHLVVDIGGGTADIAVISLSGVVESASIKVAGDQFNEAIVKYMRRKHNILIGERTAEQIKIEIGSAYPMDPEMTLEIKGRNLVDGLPKNVVVHSEDVREALLECLVKITSAIKETLERTPPELVADISNNGIVMTGGGSLVDGFDKLIEARTGIHTVVAEGAISCVAEGTGKSLDSLNAMTDGTVNLSRRKQMS